MKRPYFTLVTVLFVVACVLGNAAAAQGPNDIRLLGSPSVSVPQAGSDSQPVGAPEVVIPEDFRPAAASSPDAPAAVPVATIYFTPQDENTSTTVIFLFNTGTTAATVGLQAFSLTGGTVVNTSVSVPAKRLVRICADEVSTISATWQDVVLVNFTTTSAYAKMTLPQGVKAEAYVVWNDSSAFDPLKVSPTLPIRFSSDPATTFLPTTMRSSG